MISAPTPAKYSFAYAVDNLQANELLYRRVDLQEVVDACLAAAERAPTLGFGRYIISASTPFEPSDLADLRRETPAVVRRYFPEYEALYEAAGWRMLSSIDRVYVSRAAMGDLGWSPRYDFSNALKALEKGRAFRSPMADLVGEKGYHDGVFEDGPYPAL